MNANSFIFHSTPIDELGVLISGIVSEQLKQYLDKPKEPDNRLRDRKETAKMLGVSLPTLHEWTKNGTIKGFRVGSRVRYRLSDIEAALQNINHAKYGRG